MIRLYYWPGSCSLASHIALQEAGADFEAVCVNFRTQDQQKPEYLAINPKGRIPALITDAGVLTETPAILAWIAQAYPDAGLAPIDPWGFAQAQAFNLYLCATVHVAYAHRLRGYRWADQESSFEDMRRKAPQNMTECFRQIEDEMFKGPFVLGEQFSICDGYLFTFTRWLEGIGVDARQFPNIQAHQERIRARPAVRNVLAEEAA